MEKTPWFPPHTPPTRRGLYERDWRGTDILPEEDRRIMLDEWIPVRNPRDILYPGVWYVLPERNDASRQHLPWRGLARPNDQAQGAGGGLIAGGSPGATGCASNGNYEEREDKQMECHKLDNDKQVFFYEQDFYVLSNFSAFAMMWKGQRFGTSEAAYHWGKFPDQPGVRYEIITAMSAHEAFKVAERNKALRRSDWDTVKADVMRDILREKARQHEYVQRKLLATGDRELIEDSWRDDFWGWGPNRDGQNMLGRLWMEVRAELRGLTHNG